jgi:arrestin-2
MKKLGPTAYPFTFNFPPNAPNSVTLQAGDEDTGKPLGVFYNIKTYVAENEEQESHKRSSVSLIIKKVRPVVTV